MCKGRISCLFSTITGFVRTKFAQPPYSNENNLLFFYFQYGFLPLQKPLFSTNPRTKSILKIHLSKTHRKRQLLPEAGTRERLEVPRIFSREPGGWRLSRRTAQRALGWLHVLTARLKTSLRAYLSRFQAGFATLFPFIWRTWKNM